MEAINLSVAVAAILASVVSIVIFYKARNQWGLLSEGCWDGRTVRLLLSNGLEEVLRKERRTGNEFCDFHFRFGKDVKVIGMAFPCARKYLPAVSVSGRRSRGYGKVDLEPFSFIIKHREHEKNPEYGLIFLEPLPPDKIWQIHVEDNLQKRWLTVWFEKESPEGESCESLQVHVHRFVCR